MGLTIQDLMEMKVWYTPDFVQTDAGHKWWNEMSNGGHVLFRHYPNVNDEIIFDGDFWTVEERVRKTIQGFSYSLVSLTNPATRRTSVSLDRPFIFLRPSFWTVYDKKELGCLTWSDWRVHVFGS